MKLIFLSVFFLVSINSLHSSCVDGNEIRFTPNSVIHLLFEMFRGLIINGDCDKNLSKLDPIIFDLNQVSLEGIFMKGELNATNAVLTGLGQFSLENFEFSPADVSVNVVISIPMLKLETDHYEMDGNIFGVLPFSGTGVFFVTVKDIILNTRVYFKQSDDGRSILVDHLENTYFTIGTIVSLTEYDKNIDQIVNAIIEDVFPTKLSRFSRYIAATYQDRLVAVLNPMMAAYETWGILASIL